ncbi:Acetyl-CoA_synthetase [Hexamita inflata]|uniref:Acetyl-CoA synthetase n=1 Tax=Hexamita inflata TaxID=28002 RepID=A0AA86P0E5_9EUKA|nr:Acetyl-CoA synthetase [Hexamita inflata]
MIESFTSSASNSSIAILSQSQSLLDIINNYGKINNIRFSSITLLNELPNEKQLQLLKQLSAQTEIKAIILFLKSNENIQVLRQQLTQACLQKPVIVLNVGQCSNIQDIQYINSVFDAFMNNVGAICVKNISDLLSMARIFQCVDYSKLKFTGVEQFAIITNAGGPGIIATDAFDTFGVNLASISPETKFKLQQVLPAAASVNNPIDVIGDAPPKRFNDALEILLSDSSISGVLVLATPADVARPVDLAHVCVNLHQKYPDKLFVTSFMGGVTMIQPSAILGSGGIPNFAFPEEAIHAMSAVVFFAENRLKPVFNQKQLLNEDELNIIKKIIQNEIISTEKTKNDQNKNDQNGTVLSQNGAEKIFEVLKTTVKQTDEMIKVPIKLKRNADFGNIILVGDVAELGCAYNQQKGVEQLQRTHLFEVLNGVRGQKGVDVNGIIEVIVKLNEIFTVNNEIDEIEAEIYDNDGIHAQNVKIAIK